MSEIRNLDASGYIGLFARVQGATFANINLRGFELKGYINSATAYLGILVGKAEGRAESLESVVKTTFENISIAPNESLVDGGSNSVEIIKNTTNGYTNNNAKVYLGMIAGYADNSEFINCEVDGVGIFANIIGNSNTLVGIGGIVGYANNCTLTNNTNENKAFILTLQHSIAEGSKVLPNIYVGALIGETGEIGVNLNNNSYIADKIVGDLTEQVAQIGKQN